MQGRPAIAPGERIYAIGDVHGRLDLLGELLERIKIDAEARGVMSTTVIQLGNLIDLGPSSADLIQHFMTFTELSRHVVVLKGNHEEAMTEALDGDLCVLSIWLEMGGAATLKSWGVNTDLIKRQQLTELIEATRQLVPNSVLKWLKELPLYYQSGDFFFVHAGIRPGIALAEQQPEDLLWIESEFTDSKAMHGVLVVHGHSVDDHGPTILPNRICINTGGHRTGKLTALGIEDREIWTLMTG